MDIVVLDGTAFETMLTPFRRFVLEQINFMCITPFVGGSVFLGCKFVFIAVGGVDL